MQPDLIKLQNGSDIRGVAIPGIPGESVNLNSEVASLLGKAFLSWLCGHLEKKPSALYIAVGNDSRLSAAELKQAFIESIIENGGNIYDAGMATTPAMFMTTQFKQFNCDGSVMLTASHLPYNRNGFKFFTQQSGLDKDDISNIIDIAENGQWIISEKKGKLKKIDLITDYSTYLVDFIRQGTQLKKPLKGKKIIVDAGNGAGGFFAEKVLPELGADTNGSQFLEPDGHFPNHIPNPEDKRAMASLVDTVKNVNADLGIIFDTDVDRAAIVDKTGRPVNRNRLIALLSAIILEEHPGSYVVTDSVTSAGLTKFIVDCGGIHFRFRRGYRNVINKSVEINKQGKESWLAIETSGHGALKENYFLDDGAFMTAKILIKFANMAKQQKSIEDLIANLKEAFESKEYRLLMLTEDFVTYGNEIFDRLKIFAGKQKGWRLEKENYEGIRVVCDRKRGDGWFLMRLSLHDPVMALNVESNSPGGLNLIVSKLHRFLKEFDHINLDSLS